MSARSGMTDLISRLRSMTSAGTADAQIVAGGTVTYWTDDQLQAMLDRYRRDYTFAPMAEDADQVGGTVVYKRYRFSSPNVERAESGSAIWKITDSLGNIQGTALYSIDYDGQVVTFAADQGGTAYYLSYREFNVYRAAADVWRQKASHVAEGYDIRTDNHDLKRSQRVAQYLKMAAQYESMSISVGSSSRGGMARVRRSDAY